LQRQIAGASAKHIGHHNHPITGINVIGGVANFGFHEGPVIFGADANGGNTFLLAHHMLHGGQILFCKTTMRDNYNPNHLTALTFCRPYPYSI
jgi:hypothetical protein